METLKTKIKKVIQQEIVEEQEMEVALPFFSRHKSGSHIFFMIGEDESVVTVIQSALGHEANISRDTWGGLMGWRNEALQGIVITREEYMEQYDKAIKFILQSPKPVPTREEVEQL